jgi:uncharacterized protein (TIGR02598 family)
MNSSFITSPMRSGPKKARAGVQAFSLVEVVISLAIVAFAFIGIVGLFPYGIKSNRDSVEESRALNLIQTMVADWQSTAWSTNNTPSPAYGLPSLANVTKVTNGTLYVGEDGGTNSSPANSFYRVTYTIYPGSSTVQPAYVDWLASWPAATPVNNVPSSIETVTTFFP